MAQTSRFWNGLSGGDATVAPYDADTEFAKVLNDLGLAGASGRILSTDNQAKGGIFRGVTNDAGTAVLAQLAVTGTSSPVSVGSGRAMVAGTWYENSTAVTFSVSTPVSATRIDRVVLRKDWAAKTVRLALLAGSEGGAAPALTRSWGATWEISLAQVSITTGGVIAVDDERPFLGSGIIYDNTLLATASVIDIVGIPAVYDTLELRLMARGSSSAGTYTIVNMRFNNDSGSNYGDFYQPSGTVNFSLTAGANDPKTSGIIGVMPLASDEAGAFGHFVTHIPYYARTDRNAVYESNSFMSLDAARGAFNMKCWGQRRNTDAVNRITLIPAAGSFAIGTSVQLRGVPAP